MLDVGAGTGRVSLDLAARGVVLVALDIDAALLEALEHRATGLSVETVVADARQMALGRQFSLVIVPMQTLQLLGGARGRAAFLRRALAHLEPGGLLAVLADAAVTRCRAWPAVARRSSSRCSPPAHCSCSPPRCCRRKPAPPSRI